MSYSSAKRAGSLCAASISSRSSGSRSRAFTAFSAVGLSVWLMGREARKVTRPCAFCGMRNLPGKSAKLEGKFGKGWLAKTCEPREHGTVKGPFFQQTGFEFLGHARLSETLIPGERLPRGSRREQLFGPGVSQPPGHRHRKQRPEWKRLPLIRRGRARR